MSTNKKKNIAGHVIAGLLALAFLAAGGSKLAGAAPHPAQFEGWGYPIWFMYVTGLVELSGAILVAIPRTRLYGALALAATMLGAIGTHVVNGEFGALIAPIVLLTLAGTTIWLTRAVDETSESTHLPAAEAA
jgi:uncharacterized membrane protein YphA (DoxX/SURF4 family)